MIYKVKFNIADEVGLRKANENLIQIMEEINLTGDKVSKESDGIASSGQSLSRGAVEQSATLENTRKSVEIIASQTQQNADNARQSNKLAAETNKLAENGNEQMSLMLRAMEDINASSLGVSKIIKVIDEIAFQTNLLALNAAVEAARAGKYGKGFAVVAEEVRNLSQRSAKAARETNEMIESAVEKADSGMKIAQGTSASLKEIVVGISKVTDIVSEITKASEEQTKGIEIINADIAQLSKVTDQNTKVSEENSSTSEELIWHVNKLKQLVARFKLHNQDFVQQTDVALPLLEN